MKLHILTKLDGLMCHGQVRQLLSSWVWSYLPLLVRHGTLATLWQALVINAPDDVLQTMTER